MTKRVGIVATVGFDLHLQTGVLNGGRLSPGIVLLPTSFVEMLLTEQFEQVVALASPGLQADEPFSEK